MGWIGDFFAGRMGAVREVFYEKKARWAKSLLSKDAVHAILVEPAGKCTRRFTLDFFKIVAI